MKVRISDIERLLGSGTKFVPRSRPGAMMKVFREELEECVNSELDTHGYLRMSLHNGTEVKYNFDPAKQHWNQVI
jgi:hypothetical protein